MRRVVKRGRVPDRLQPQALRPSRRAGPADRYLLSLIGAAEVSEALRQYRLHARRAGATVDGTANEGGGVVFAGPADLAPADALQFGQGLIDGALAAWGAPPPWPRVTSWMYDQGRWAGSYPSPFGGERGQAALGLGFVAHALPRLRAAGLADPEIEAFAVCDPALPDPRLTGSGEIAA